MVHTSRAVNDSGRGKAARAAVASCVALLCWSACGRPPAKPNSALLAERQAEEAQLASQRFGTTPFSSDDQLRHSVCWETPLEAPAESGLQFGCGSGAVARE